MFFSRDPLDRSSHLRNDTALASQASDETSVIIPVWNHQPYVYEDQVRAAFLPRLSVPDAAQEDLIFLGRDDRHFFFAYDIETSAAPDFLPQARFRDLRTVAPLLATKDASILAYAQAMVWWRRRNRYCGNCGSRNVSTKSGHVLLCSNPDCGIQQFPRLDPAIIVLVTDGERALLGRQASWPAGRYSTLAGFVEPGETLEDAVRREVMEETGVSVGSVEYFASQPWPFPSSLMIGFHAQAQTTVIRLNDAELEHAQWFSAAEVTVRERSPEFSGSMLPPSGSISFSLIEHWFDASGHGKLREVATDSAWPTA